MSKKITTALFILLLCATGSRAQLPMDRMPRWLLGLWEQPTARGSVFESWTRSSSNSFAGKSYVLKGTDTMVLETVQLRYELQSLQYIPTVKGQNGDKPVVFTAVESGIEQLIFENPEHDFPQRISYTRINQDSVIAVISGRRNGKESKREFPMRRVK